MSTDISTTPVLSTADISTTISTEASTPPTLPGLPDDTQTPPTLKRSSTPVSDKPQPLKRSKTVNFSSDEKDDKTEMDEKAEAEETTAMTPEQSQLIEALVGLLQDGKVTVTALLAVFDELKTLPHSKTKEPADDAERAFEHRVMMDKVREATVSAWKKAHIQMSKVPVIELD